MVSLKEKKEAALAKARAKAAPVKVPIEHRALYIMGATSILLDAVIICLVIGLR